MLNGFECRRLLGADGIGHHGLFRVTDGEWEVYEPALAATPLDHSPYLVPLLPVDFHRHAVGGIDLSDLEKIDLYTVNETLVREGIRCVLTVFLARQDVSAFSEFARGFGIAKTRGEHSHIAGLALEGPLLSSPGGTPPMCVWSPTKREWERLAACGGTVLKYIVLSPDSKPHGAGSHQQPAMGWITTLLLEAGVSPALGHFRKDDPAASAHAIDEIFEAVADVADAPPLLSDHLFNDMPRSFQHAWRTSKQKKRREQELAALSIQSWQLENIDERLGVVPATLIRGAHEGRITLCLNFDGEHVDLKIAREVVRLAGADHIIALTDRVDGQVLARQILLPSADNRLLYRQDGVVVAGSIGLDEQMTNMRRIGVSEENIWKMASFNACRALGIDVDADDRGRPHVGSLVDAIGVRTPFELAGATRRTTAALLGGDAM